MNPNDSITAEIRNTPQAQHLLECLVAAHTLPDEPMKRYIGTKIIQAFPESKGPMPGDEEGYAVIYEDGYRSWSPKAVFEAAYKERPPVEGLQPHQQRVVDEKADLDDKSHALAQFITYSPIFEKLAPSEQAFMRQQYDAMRLYSVILGGRIAAFQSPGSAKSIHKQCSASVTRYLRMLQEASDYASDKIARAEQRIEQEIPAKSVTMLSVTRPEVARLIQWFNAVEDLNRAYLEPEDRLLANKLMWEQLLQTDSLPPEIKPGDVVSLKSGGQRMTVGCIARPANGLPQEATCHWIADDGRPYSKVFDLGCLEIQQSH